MQASTTYLSVSQIKTFLQCPRQYRLRYIEKVRPEFRSASLAFGTAWHAAVGSFLWMSDAGPPRIDELLDRFKDALDRELAEYDVPVLFDDDDSGLDALLERARTMLDTFVREFPMPSRVLALEEPFLLELAHPATGERLDLPLVGALDALIERDGKVMVLEVKSAKRRWSKDQLEQDLQGTAYRMAARALGHLEAEVELVATTKATKPTIQIERLTRNRADEVELVELSFGIVKAARAGVDHRNRGWQCRGCAYAGTCAL